MEGYVYIMRRQRSEKDAERHGYKIKVGKTSRDPLTRRKELQTGSPEKLEFYCSVFVPNMSAFEKAVKDYLCFCKTRDTDGGTEWFLVSADELISLKAKMAAEDIPINPMPICPPVYNNEILSTELHRFLQITKWHSQWIETWINKMLNHKKDFLTYKLESTGGRRAEAYLISLNAAKHICGATDNFHGERIRQYLIDFEEGLIDGVRRLPGQLKMF